MYCVKCGVELADSEKKCPLCGTPVFHPDIPRNLSDPPFPPDRRIRPEDVNRSGILFVLTVAGAAAGAFVSAVRLAHQRDAGLVRLCRGRRSGCFTS